MPLKQAYRLCLVKNEFELRKDVWVLAFLLYVLEAALRLEDWFYYQNSLNLFLLLNRIGYFGIGIYFFSLNENTLKIQIIIN